MIRKFHTPGGIIEGDLTHDEIIRFAAMGDQECKLFLAREEWEEGSSIPKKINMIADYLGLR